MRRFLAAIFAFGSLAALPQLSAQGALAPDQLEQAATRFADRLAETSQELADARQRIGDEKQALAQALSQSETRRRQLQAELDALRQTRARLLEETEQAQDRLASLRDNRNYLATALSESVRTAAKRLSPLQSDASERLVARSNRLLDPSADFSSAFSEALRLLGDQLDQSMGGYAVEGVAANAESRAAETGVFLLFGPTAAFIGQPSAHPAAVRFDDDSELPIAIPLPQTIEPNFLDRIVSGDQRQLLLDPTNRDAMRLSSARGDVFEHVRKGGVVGYVIIGLGLFALATALFKLYEQRRHSVEGPGEVAGALSLLTQRDEDAFAEKLNSLRASTRRLFHVGLAHLRQPQEVLEERLYADILLHRLEHEKKLPQLRVIAAAAPLLGLLGTVVGMVQTFTLITVHGSGNAEKLSSGISQALVTTELGLIVAIPTLVAYGFLSQRAHRNLSLLEQHASAFVAASRQQPDNSTSDARP